MSHRYPLPLRKPSPQHRPTVSHKVHVPIKTSVSVIIPTLNEASRVARAATSAWVAGADQVIVADAGSTDGTQQAAAKADATVITSQRGRAQQQNAGAAVASGDILLFLHADNWLAQPAIGELRSACSLGKQKVGAFCQQIDAHGIPYRMLEWGNRWRVRLFRRPYGDQGIFITSELFHVVGGFPNVPLMEELLLIAPRWQARPPHLAQRPNSRRCTTLATERSRSTDDPQLVLSRAILVRCVA